MRVVFGALVFMKRVINGVLLFARFHARIGISAIERKVLSHRTFLGEVGLDHRILTGSHMYLMSFKVM